MEREHYLQEHCMVIEIYWKLLLTLLVLTFQELKNSEAGQSKVDAAREQVFNQGLTYQMLFIKLNYMA